MVIKDIATWELGEVVFSRDQSTITLITRIGFHMYGLNGEQICEGELLPSSNNQLGAHWVDGESLLFAVSSKADGELMISIQKLQPTMDPLLLVTESFIIPFQNGEFCFSPVSFHAAFFYGTKAVVLNVRDSKVLFHGDGVQSYYSPGHFSPDGCFFACRTSGGSICILEKTSRSYVPRSNLTPQLSWDKFSWSPTSTSILCWDRNGIQLLHPDNCYGLTFTRPPYREHLVAYTVDQTHIATAHQRNTVITFTSLSDATQQTVTINIPIRDIKIVDSTIFVTDGTRLISWYLTTGGQAGSGCNTGRENKVFSVHTGEPFALSNNCSQIGFTIKQTVFLYDIKTQKVLGDFMADGHIYHIQFSSDGSLMWSVVENTNGKGFKCYCMELEREQNPCFANMTIVDLKDDWSLDSLFRSPQECRIIGNGSEWVSDPRGNILWLPPNWRVGRGWSARWDGNFLTLLGGHHPEPIIIEFQL